jgi:hypothetical protein
MSWRDERRVKEDAGRGMKKYVGREERKDVHVERE